MQRDSAEPIQYTIDICVLGSVARISGGLRGRAKFKNWDMTVANTSMSPTEIRCNAIEWDLGVDCWVGKSENVNNHLVW